MVDSDDRSATAKGMDRVGRVTTGTVLLVLPPVVGHLIDQRLNTVFVFLLLGFALGLAVGFWHLYKLVQDLSQDES